MGNDETAADRWYRQYLEYAGRAKGTRKGDSLEDTLRSLDAALRPRNRARRAYVTTEDVDAVPTITIEKDDTRTSTYTGRRPAPAIAQVKVVTFAVTEFASVTAAEDYPDLVAGWVKEERGMTVVDIDGNEVYVARDAVQRAIADGSVPGFSALTPEEADSLHLVLVEAEHYQRALLRQAVIDGDHDPADVLAMSRAEAGRRAYRHRLNLPKHEYSVECCGAGLAAPERGDA